MCLFTNNMWNIYWFISEEFRTTHKMRHDQAVHSLFLSKLFWHCFWNKKSWPRIPKEALSLHAIVCSSLLNAGKFWSKKLFPHHWIKFYRKSSKFWAGAVQWISPLERICFWVMGQGCPSLWMKSVMTW